MEASDLSLAALEAHDPRGGRGNRERRFRCPLPGCDGDKSRNLSVNQDLVWTCYKCGESGRLVESRTPRQPWAPQDRAAKSRDMMARMSGHAPTKPQPRRVATARECDPKEGGYDFERETRAVGPLAGTEGAAYLDSRGLPTALVQACGVRFSPSFGCGRWWPDGGGRRFASGRPALVFPLKGPQGNVTGIAGRASSRDGYLFRDRDAKTVSKQTRKVDPEGDAGIFSAPYDAARADAVGLTEAPIDALSLHLCGLPTVATIGTGCPDWLIDRLAFRVVFLAHDDDAPDPRGVRAGDAAAERIAAELRAVGARPVRLRPPTGCKDWNEALQRFGKESLSTALALAVEPFMSPTAPYVADAAIDPGAAYGIPSSAPPSDDKAEPFKPDTVPTLFGPEHGQGDEKQPGDDITRLNDHFSHELTSVPEDAPGALPLVGSAAYRTLKEYGPDEDRRLRACAAAGMPSSAALGEMLDKIDRGEAIGSDHFRAGQLKAAVEIEATRIVGR